MSASSWRVPLGWACAGTVARLAWLHHQPAVAAWDGVIYERTARRIALGMGFVDRWDGRPPFHPTAFYPVGYPATLGALFAVFGAHAWVAALLNVLAAALSTALAVRVATHAWGAVPGHVAGGITALAPGGVAWASSFMTETLSAALLVGAVATGLAHARTRRASWAVLTGLLLGAGGLVRPPALLVAPVLALLCVPRLDARAAVRTLALVGLASAAVVLPWTARNCRQLDGCALVSVNGGSNLWIGTDPEAHGGYRDLRRGEGCDAVRGEVHKDRCYGALATARIREHPFAWLALVPQKLGQTLAYEGTPVSYLQRATGDAAFGTHAPFAYVLLTSVHLATLTLALLGAMRAGEPRPRAVVVVLGVVGALLAVHCVFFGGDRYHLVFAPLTAVLAGGAFRRVPRDATAT